MDVLGSTYGADAVTMILKPDKTVYPAGSVPDFTVIIRNNGNKPVKLCTYMLHYRLKAAMIAKGISEKTIDYELQPFHTQIWEPVEDSDFKIIEPDKQLSLQIELSKEHQFGFIRRHSQPPVIPVNLIIKGFPSGTYEFSTAIYDQIAIYVGESGVFDYRLETRLIPELPGGKDAYIQLIEASVNITFK